MLVVIHLILCVLINSREALVSKEQSAVALTTAHGDFSVLRILIFQLVGSTLTRKQVTQPEGLALGTLGLAQQ